MPPVKCHVNSPIVSDGYSSTPASRHGWCAVQGSVDGTTILHHKGLPPRGTRSRPVGGEPIRISRERTPCPVMDTTFTGMASVPRCVHHATWLTTTRGHINDPSPCPTAQASTFVVPVSHPAHVFISHDRRDSCSFRCLSILVCVLVLHTPLGVESRNDVPPVSTSPTCPSWAFLAANVPTSSRWCSSQEWIERAPIPTLLLFVFPGCNAL